MASNGPEKMVITRRQLLKAVSVSLAGLSLPMLAACGQTAQPTAAPAAQAPTQAPAPAATKAPAAPAAAPTATTASGPKKGGTLINTAGGDLTFDPYFNTGQAGQSWRFFNALFDYHDPKNAYQATPSLAESYEETDKTLTVKLRKGVKFHNGREMVAQDVVDNVNRALDKSIGHYLYAPFSASVDGAEATDQYTVKINYKSVYPVKLDDLAAMYIIPKEAMGTVAAKPVGTGPFKFVNYAPGDKLESARFEDYWEKGKPYLDGVTSKVIADPQARLANLQGGSVDYIDRMALSDVARMKNEGKLQIVGSPPGGTWYSNVLNCAKKPFDNKMVRQAMNFSIDRDKVNKLAYYDLAPVTQVRYLPDQPWYSKQAATFYTFDLKKAKDLLTQAGLPDGFKTTIVVGEAVLPGSKAMAQVWAQDLAKIGVTMEIVEREQGPFYDEYQKGNFDIQAYGLGDGKLDPATALSGNSPTRLENNKANIQTLPFYDDYKKLVQDGISTIDPKVRKPIYDKIQQIWIEEGWVIITAFWLSFTGLTPRVKGFWLPADQRPYLGDVSLEG